MSFLSKDVYNFLKKLPTIAKGLFIIFLFIIFLIMIFTGIFLSSTYSIGYISGKLADTSKEITNKFKEKGLDSAVVESTVSLGLISFKVIGKDKYMQ